MSVIRDEVDKITERVELIHQKFIFPWDIEALGNFGGGFTIFDAKKSQVMYCPSYTGDGAEINMEYDEAKAMVDLLNTLSLCLPERRKSEICPDGLKK